MNDTFTQNYEEEVQGDIIVPESSSDDVLTDHEIPEPSSSEVLDEEVYSEEYSEESGEQQLEVLEEETSSEIDFSKYVDAYFKGLYGEVDGSSDEVLDTEEEVVYSNLEEFEQSTLEVDLYQYTVLQRLEFMQYALAMIVALLVINLFLRAKK